MGGSILYCGDTDLNGAAAYLAGLMTSWGWGFDYVASHEKMSQKLVDQRRSLLILSDYPATQFDPECQQRVLKHIEQGCGLLMIGGWESYHGFGGNWDGTLLGAALPVEIDATDDRMNFDQSAWLVSIQDHPILSDLPWSKHPPAIGGMNRVRTKAGANLLLEAQSFTVTTTLPTSGATSDRSIWSFTKQESYPALVVGEHGQGRTASFMSDVAPHWVGGFVDWGLPRVTGQAKNGQGIEVGHDYAKFWKQLLEWTGKLR